MEVCFDKDTLGHFFPTELATVWPFRETKGKPDIPLNTPKDELCVHI